MTSVNLSIPELTWKKLGEWGKIALPEVGTFSLESTSAQLDLVKNTIISGESFISYFQHFPKDSKFNIQEANVDKNQLQENYALFLVHFKLSMDHDGRYYFPHIGTLENTDQGIILNPDPASILIQRGNELQQISFTPIDRTYTKPETDAPLAHPGKLRKKHSVSGWTWLILFLVVNTALIFWLVEKKRIKAGMDSLSVSLPDNRLNVKPSADAPLPDVPEVKKDTFASNDSVLIESTKDSTDLQNVEINTPEEIKEAPIIKNPGSSAKPPKPESHPEALVDPSQKTDFQIETSKPQTGKCAIIVGSFKEISNVRKMEQQIEKAGFEAFSQKGNRLTKVGIVTGCEEVATVLKFAQSNFHPDAWVHPIQ